MEISKTVKIGSDLIDISKPQDVVTALKKMQLKIATGGQRSSVRIDDEEITFTAANDARLAKLIAHYENEASRASGGRRRRYAKRFTFC